MEVATLACGAIARIVVYHLFPSVPATLDGHVEISTPVTSFKRLQEGLYLYKQGIDPYDGGIFHQSPLLLGAVSAVSKIVPETIAINILYVLADLTAAWALAQTAQRAATTIKYVFKKKDTKEPLPFAPWIIAAIYLFNPLLFLSSAAKSTAVFNNAAICYTLAAATHGHFLTAAASLALATNLSYYPIYLAPLVSLLLHGNSGTPLKTNKAQYGFRFCLLSASYTAAILLLSQAIAGSWNFLGAVYGTILTGRDLTPNIGLWWYFFTEMFDFFQPFFTGVFQIHVFLYAAPITLRFSSFPLFAITLYLGLVALFKAYPDTADVGIFFSLVPFFRPLFPLLRYPIPAFLALLYSSVLLPTFFHMWIYLGSGNANFFYAITLVYALGMTVCISDLTWAMLRLEHDGGEDPNLSQI